MIINTEEPKEIERIERVKAKLIEEKREKNHYTSEDIVLVRVTAHLPSDGYIPALSNVPFVHRMNDLSKNAIMDILEENGKTYDEIKEIISDYVPLSTQYRSSIHFCLNGLVSSHMYGNFENNPYVIIEPFKHHENDENILAVRGEDTYFKDGIALSNDAIILVDERYAAQVTDSKISEHFKVIFYKGKQELAVESVLLDMGIVPELIGKDYIIDSDTSKYITDFITHKQYPRDKHCFSESYKTDDEKNIILWEKYAKEFFTFLYTKIYGNIDEKISEIDYLSKASSFEQIPLLQLKNLIKEIGLDAYRDIVQEYNALIIEKINSGNYPNNNQILEGTPLDINKQKTI